VVVRPPLTLSVGPVYDINYRNDQSLEAPSKVVTRPSASHCADVDPDMRSYVMPASGEGSNSKLLYDWHRQKRRLSL